MIFLKVEKEEFKRVINDASHLEYNYIHRDLEKITDPNLKDEEVEYLILNQIHHRLLKNSHRSLFVNKIIIKSIDEKDYKLLRYYVEALSENHYRIK